LAATVRVVDTESWGTGSSGGPFSARPTGFDFVPGGTGLYSAGAGNFLTFCLELDEFLSPNEDYTVSFSSEAKYNGGAGADPLDPRTAFLYTAFIDGSLPAKAAAASFTWNYGTPGGSDSEGSAFQDAVWFLEGEILSVSGLAQSLVNLANASGWTDIGSVRVMNLWDGAIGTNPKQDLLVLVPTPTASLAGMSLLAGIVAVGWYRRRRRNIL